MKSEHTTENLLKGMQTTLFPEVEGHYLHF